MHIFEVRCIWDSVVSFIVRSTGSISLAGERQILDTGDIKSTFCCAFNMLDQPQRIR